MMVFPFAARSDVPVVDIISPPTTMERTAIVVVPMRRYFPIFARRSLRFALVPPVYFFSEGLRLLGSRVKFGLVMLFGSSTDFSAAVDVEFHVVVLSVFCTFIAVSSF